MWESGDVYSPQQYSNFHSASVNSDDLDCVSIDLSGPWSYESCFLKTYPYVCEYGDFPRGISSVLPTNLKELPYNSSKSNKMSRIMSIQ